MNSDLKNFYGILIKWKPWTVYWKYFYFLKIGHATNLHEGDYPQYIPEEGLNFVHPAYQSGGHQPFDYSAYTHQGGFTANQENNENEGEILIHNTGVPSHIFKIKTIINNFKRFFWNLFF